MFILYTKINSIQKRTINRKIIFKRYILKKWSPQQKITLVRQLWIEYFSSGGLRMQHPPFLQIFPGLQVPLLALEPKIN